MKTLYKNKELKPKNKIKRNTTPMIKIIKHQKKIEDTKPVKIPCIYNEMNC